MLKKVIESLEQSPIVKKGDYNYFVNPISDGVPSMNPEILNELTEAIIANIDLDVDKIVAIEAMGIHLATSLSLATGIPFVVIRKREYGLEGEKEIYQETGYGHSKLYINDIAKGDKILLIDDVVSTGGTLIATLNALKEIGADIKAVVPAIEKGKGKQIVESATNVPITSIVKVDIEDGKVVIKSTIED